MRDPNAVVSLLGSHSSEDQRFDRRAYCLSQGTSASLSTDKNNHISSLFHVLHYLSTSDVGVCGARQKCRDENWRARC